MLDLLGLTPETLKGKASEKQITKAQRFNLIFTKLKERNADNEAFIKKYIKQANKRRDKLNERKSSYQGEQDHKQKDRKQTSLKKSSSNEHIKPIEQIKMSGSLNRLIEDTVKNSLLKRTNHTQEAFDDENKVSSFPAINYLTVVHKSEHQTTYFKPIFQQNRDFKNYGKNVTREKQTKKIVLEISDSTNTQNASTTRLKTDFGGKFHLSIKSLIFGSQQLNSDKSNAQSIKHSIFTTQSSENPQKKHNKECHFYDDKLISKGVLPTLNIHSTPKHHQFLQNYIKVNADKLNKNRCTIKPNPIESDQAKRVNSSRNKVSFRINTIQIKKQF